MTQVVHGNLKGTDFTYVCAKEDTINSLTRPLKFYEKDIKSIVTKEQFNFIKYKVGGENE